MLFVKGVNPKEIELNVSESFGRYELTLHLRSCEENLEKCSTIPCSVLGVNYLGKIGGVSINRRLIGGHYSNTGYDYEITLFTDPEQDYSELSTNPFKDNQMKNNSTAKTEDDYPRYGLVCWYKSDSETFNSDNHSHLKPFSKEMCRIYHHADQETRDIIMLSVGDFIEPEGMNYAVMELKPIQIRQHLNVWADFTGTIYAVDEKQAKSVTASMEIFNKQIENPTFESVSNVLNSHRIEVVKFE